MARRRCCHDRWQRQRNDLAEHPASDQTGKNVPNGTESKVGRGLACANSTERSRNEIYQNLYDVHINLPYDLRVLFSSRLEATRKPPRILYSNLSDFVRR